MAQCLSAASNTNCYTANTPERNSAVEKFQKKDKQKKEKEKKNILKILKISPLILTNFANAISIVKVAVGQQ